MNKRKLLLLVASFVAVAGLLSAQAADPYRVFKSYLAAAKKGVSYPGAPLKGKVVGFANALGVLPFCAHVEAGLKKQLALAGLDLTRGWISMDNQYNPAVSLKNVDAMIARRPDLVIEYQMDQKTNYVIAGRLGVAKIPVLAVDVPVPGAPLVETNNYTIAVLAGRTMARLIREKWGGWDAVDLVVIMKVSAPGEGIMLRAEGVADALADEFGVNPQDPKIVRAVDGLFGDKLEETKATMAKVLEAHPEAVKIALSSTNEQLMAGSIAAMKEAGRWDPDNKVIVTRGVDELGQSLIRDGLSDAGAPFFPEYYGQYIVPAVAAMLTGNAAPPATFVESEIITKANIDRWYPKQ